MIVTNMKIALSPNFKSTEFGIPCIVTLSDTLRLSVQISGDIGQEKMSSILKGIVEDFEYNPDYLEAKESLKVVSPSDTIMRQIDIRSDSNSKILFKTFTSWSHEYNLWHVFIELGNEDWVEENIMSYDNN